MGRPAGREGGHYVLAIRPKRHEATKIVAGHYSLRLEAGKKRVRIFSFRETPDKVDPAMNAPVRKLLIPPQYNVNTTLEATVEPRDDNQLDFRLPTD